MSGVRVLVGTRKGAFVLTSDEDARASGTSAARIFAGWEMYHLKGSPVDPNRIYASQSSGWFGQIIQRSDDGGQTWEPVGNEFAYDGVPGTHQWYDGTQHPWEFARVWHLEPSLTDPDTVYAGVEDAAMFRSTDGGQTWQELSGLREHKTRRRSGSPGAGGCACTRSSSTPTTRSASSSPSPRRAPSAPMMAARPGSRSTAGCARSELPDEDAEVGHCVHRIAMHPSRPDVLFMQKHWDVMRSDDAGESWHEVSGNLPTDFGFPIDVHAHEPETIYVVPIKSDSEHFPPDGQAARLPQPDRRQRVGGADERPAPERLLRQRPARRHGRRLARSLRRLLRHDRRTGLRVAGRGTPGRRSCVTCRPCCRSRCRRCRDPRRASAAPADPGRRRRQGELEVGGRYAAHAARRARGPLSRAARHHPRPRYREAGVCAILRLREDLSHESATTRCPTRSPGRRAVPGGRGDRRRVRRRSVTYGALRFLIAVARFPRASRPPRRAAPRRDSTDAWRPLLGVQRPPSDQQRRQDAPLPPACGRWLLPPGAQRSPHPRWARPPAHRPRRLHPA